jgi:hypothetical protein
MSPITTEDWLVAKFAGLSAVIMIFLSALIYQRTALLSSNGNINFAMSYNLRSSNSFLIWNTKDTFSAIGVNHIDRHIVRVTRKA